VIRLPSELLVATFDRFRTCGAGRRECQSLWLGPWAEPDLIDEVVHPAHAASAVGFQLDSRWLDRFWADLANRGVGVRVQVHTHPGAAYHSATDDSFPLLRHAGFLSLVIPRFALGSVGFTGAFLAQLQADGSWREVPIAEHLEVIG
jgi:hypothetical protein